MVIKSLSLFFKHYNECLKYTNAGTHIDFNTLTVPGLYSVYSDSNSTYHSPTHGWFQIYVSRTNNSSNYVQQIAIQNSALYIRYCDNGDWSNWSSVSNFNIHKYNTDTDLNTFITPGVYGLYINNANISACHAPNYWYMIVYVSVVDSIVNQIVVTTVDNAIYERSSGNSGSTWTGWHPRSTIRIGRIENITNDNQWHEIQLSYDYTYFRLLHVIARIDWSAILTHITVPVELFQNTINNVVTYYIDDSGTNKQGLSINYVDNDYTKIKVSISQSGIMDQHENSIYVYGSP